MPAQIQNIENQRQIVLIQAYEGVNTYFGWLGQDLPGSSTAGWGNLVRKPNIADFMYFEILLTSAIFKICSKFAPILAYR